MVEVEVELCTEPHDVAAIVLSFGDGQLALPADSVGVSVPSPSVTIHCEIARFFVKK